MEKERNNFLKRQQEAPSELVNVSIPDTHLKSISERDTREAPCRIQRTREASREEALVSMRQFFATVEERNRHDSMGRPIGVSSESGGREDLMYLVLLLLLSLPFQLFLMLTL